MSIEAIGDFTAEEARGFYNMLIEDAVSNDDWLRVFEVSPECVASCNITTL